MPKSKKWYRFAEKKGPLYVKDLRLCLLALWMENEFLLKTWRLYSKTSFSWSLLRLLVDFEIYFTVLRNFYETDRKINIRANTLIHATNEQQKCIQIIST